jgi:hypothetical protein
MTDTSGGTDGGAPTTMANISGVVFRMRFMVVLS